MSRREIPTAALLARLPLFSDLAPEALDRLAAEATRHRLERGDVLFRQGEPALGIYLVVYGRIKLVAATPARGSRLTGWAGPGESFGEPVMFLERPTLVQAQAADDALVLRVPKAAVFAELDRNPRFARQMIAGLSRRVHTLVHDLDRQSSGSGAARFAAYLLRQAEGQPSLAWTLPAAKREIASQLNLTPEHFSRILRELVDAGLIEVQGRRIVVPDTGRLQQAARRR
ncbi:MAG: Crp/Fnr family transcriptional regulator [Proteobacteria bacterium]|nr:Crp/Fnr family transcriptional regulator [Pseudomonadota bacterium]